MHLSRAYVCKSGGHTATLRQAYTDTRASPPTASRSPSAEKLRLLKPKAKSGCKLPSSWRSCSAYTWIAGLSPCEIVKERTCAGQCYSVMWHPLYALGLEGKERRCVNSVRKTQAVVLLPSLPQQSSLASCWHWSPEAQRGSSPL